MHLWSAPDGLHAPEGIMQFAQKMGVKVLSQTFPFFLALIAHPILQRLLSANMHHGIIQSWPAVAIAECDEYALTIQVVVTIERMNWLAREVSAAELNLANKLAQLNLPPMKQAAFRKSFMADFFKFTNASETNEMWVQRTKYREFSGADDLRKGMADTLSPMHDSLAAIVSRSHTHHHVAYSSRTQEPRCYGAA